MWTRKNSERITQLFAFESKVWRLGQVFKHYRRSHVRRLLNVLEAKLNGNVLTNMAQSAQDAINSVKKRKEN